MRALLARSLGRLRAALRSQGSSVDVAAAAGRLAAFTARRATVVVGVVGLLCLGAALAALRLEPSAAIDTLVDRDTASFRATERFEREFGGEPIVILVEGTLTDLLLTQDLGSMLALEGCISGNVPKGGRPPAPVCTEFAKLRPVQVVYGPATFINESANQIAAQIGVERRRREAEARRAARAARELAKAQGRSKAEQDQLARQARELVNAQFAVDVLRLGAQYGLESLPALNNPDFVLRLVFEPSLGAGVPKSRFAYLFPSEGGALIQARLRPDLTETEQRRAIELVREAVADPVFRLERGRYVVSGAPVVSEGVASSISGALGVLLLAVLVVMAATLALVFRSPFRLLPLGLAFGAAALTFGGMSLAGVSLTIASIAALPVLVGLAVDYAIQFQAAFNEARERGVAAGGAVASQEERGTPAAQRISAREAASIAAAAGAPVIATAGLATVAGFLALLLSPVPMVRSFGWLLVVGIVASFACTLTAGFALLGGDVRLPGAGLMRRGVRVLARLPTPSLKLRRLRARSRAAPPAREAPPRVSARATAVSRKLWGAIAALARAVTRRVSAVAGRLVALLKLVRDRVTAFVRAVGRRSFAAAVRRSGRVLAVAFAAAVVGWVVGTQTEVVSDLQRLVPADLREIRDVKALQRETGTSGQLTVLVRARDLTDRKALAWMADYQKRVLDRHGYSEERSCRRAELCPALSLTNLLGSEADARPKQIRALVRALPSYFSQSVITRDRRTANMAFGIRVMPLDEQKALIDDMREQLDPPKGVEAELAGLPVLVAEANADLDSSRWLLTLAGLGAVLAVLLLVYRRFERAVVPLIPIALATGWSALVLFVLRIPLNPMSATLGALVIAISTEFSVILSARYRRERDGGLAPVAALERTYARTGAAVLASGATVIAGFGSLIVSDVPMLRNFGFVTVVDLSVALLGVMVVLPAALMRVERRGMLGLPPSRRETRAAVRALPRGSAALVRGSRRRGAAVARRTWRAIAHGALARRLRRRGRGGSPE